ncbi:hypothetical protein MRX96_032714 [Rhipicephalus microplus]
MEQSCSKAHPNRRCRVAPLADRVGQRRRWKGKEQPLSPNVFSCNNLHGSDLSSSEEENNYHDDGESSDSSSLRSCCSAELQKEESSDCSLLGADQTQQHAMVVMQCVRLLGSGPLLPMGTLVTALYRHRKWICVQTPHGVRGFIRHESCAPLGTLLPANTGRRRSVRNDNLTRNLEPHCVADKQFLEKDVDTFVQTIINAASASSIC